jgi:hypothetical protein
MALSPTDTGAAVRRGSSLIGSAISRRLGIRRIARRVDKPSHSPNSAIGETMTSGRPSRITAQEVVSCQWVGAIS